MKVNSIKYTALIILSLLFIVVALQLPVAAQIRPIFSVISPQEGEIFHPGDTISIRVQPSPGVILKAVQVMSPIGTNLVQPAGDISFTVPDKKIGRQQLLILGFNILNVEQQITRTIDIEPSAHILQLFADSDILDLVAPGTNDASQALDHVQILIKGHFDDGIDRYVTNSSQLQFSSDNPQVAVAEAGGVIRAREPGEARITFSYQAQSVVVTVKVNNFQVRGDLDGDGDVDGADLKLLKKAFGPATGLNDPRDLDHNGAIDRRDALILEQLCSRPHCQNEKIANKSDKDDDEDNMI